MGEAKKGPAEQALAKAAPQVPALRGPQEPPAPWPPPAKTAPGPGRMIEAPTGRPYLPDGQRPPASWERQQERKPTSRCRAYRCESCGGALGFHFSNCSVAVRLCSSCYGTEAEHGITEEQRAGATKVADRLMREVVAGALRPATPDDLRESPADSRRRFSEWTNRHMILQWTMLKRKEEGKDLLGFQAQDGSLWCLLCARSPEFQYQGSWALHDAQVRGGLGRWCDTCGRPLLPDEKEQRPKKAPGGAPVRPALPPGYRLLPAADGPGVIEAEAEAPAPEPEGSSEVEAKQYTEAGSGEALPPAVPVQHWYRAPLYAVVLRQPQAHDQQSILHDAMVVRRLEDGRGPMWVAANGDPRRAAPSVTLGGAIPDELVTHYVRLPPLPEVA